MRGVGWLGVFALVGATAGCAGPTFSCSDDAACGAEGRCEVGGWCSFPDSECGSGRRYAKFSGDGVGGLCVDTAAQDSDGPGTQGTQSSGATGSSSSGDAVSTLSEGSITSAPVEASSGTAGSDSDGTTSCRDEACATAGPTGASSGSTGDTDDTGGPMPPCSGFFDTFDDGEFDPSWEPYGSTAHVMEEANGELRWDFAPGIVDQRGLYRPFAGSVSSLRVNATQAPALPGSQAQMVLLFREEGGPEDLVLVWNNDSVEVRQSSTPVADSPIFEWIEIRFVAGEVLVSTSADGVDFELLTTLEAVYGEGLKSVRLYGQTWTQAPAAATAAFGSIRACEP